MRKFIRDLREKDQVHAAFLAQSKTVGTDRNGKAFMTLTLHDRTGFVNARLFERADEFANQIESGDVVTVRGFVQMFQGRKQVVLHEIRKSVEGEFSPQDLMAKSVQDTSELMSELKETVTRIKNDNIRELVSQSIQDPAIQERMLKAPAAKTIHHAYEGGLLEHVVSICRMMKAIAELYPFLDEDYLIFGAIFHDLGKIYELDLKSGIHYTTPGRLVGHMALACEMIDSKAAEIADFPAELKDLLKHIVLSHHGKIEYGSPKLPMFAEAVVVAMIDDFDSRMNMIYEFCRTEVEQQGADEKWSHFHSGFERHFFLDIFRQRNRT